MKTDYEVEGCWTTARKINTRCRVCGSLMIPVPKEGHFNSSYWNMQRHDKEQLICCPKGCSVNDGEKKIKEYLAIRGYCTKKSESWKWELDYTIVRNAWINRKGKVYPVGVREHIDFAYDMGTTEQLLEQKGWLKLSGRIDLMWVKSLSKRQIDFIFDYLVANGYEKQTGIFMDEYSSDSSGFFTIKE